MPVDIRTLGLPIVETIEPYSERLQGLTRTAAEAISALRVVRSSTLTAVVLARWPESLSTAPLGVTTTSATLGDNISIQTGGELEDNAWSWTPGSPVFLGANGTLTQTQPTTNYTLVIGKAVTPKRLLIRIQAPIYLAP